MMRTTTVPADTSEKIMEVAERLVQMRGFNGFSYADIARVLGITKASLHYHFPTKAELGRRLIDRYHETCTQLLRRIDDGDADPYDKLRGYVEIYAAVLRDDRMCLCGMLASDYATLPEPMKASIRRFFEANEGWLTGVLADGRATGALRFNGSAGEIARMLVSSLEGAMLVARSFGDVARFQKVAERLIANLKA